MSWGPIPPNFVDLSGQAFARLTVVDRAGKNSRGQVLWNCVCVCGNGAITTSNKLRSGLTQSCGCYHREMARLSGLATRKALRKPRNPLAVTLNMMKQRCYNKNFTAYPEYGGRGIKICDRWLNGDGQRSGLQCFDIDMGPKPTPAHSIDRYPDNDGNYEPGNCRWATRKEQANNRRPALCGRSKKCS